MKNFLVLYYAPQALVTRMANASLEEMQKGMEPWQKWMERCGPKLVDIGSPLIGGLRITDSGPEQTDTQITGYSIVQAEDIEDAKALLADHPHLNWAPEAAIEVYETMPMTVTRNS